MDKLMYFHFFYNRFVRLKNKTKNLHEDEIVIS